MEPVGAGQIRPPSKSVPKPAPSKPSRFASGTGGRTERKPFGDL
ncbi:hypothetical protein [Actinomadura sp. CNU-125]|nr:hypothetical protein [Actinomadura sp. CNU-125]